MTRPAAEVPWALTDARTTFFTTFAGLAAILFAWWGASGTGRQDRQTTWIAVAIVGVTVLGIGNAFWLLAGRRAVGARRGALLDLLESLDGAPTATSRGATGYVAVASTGRYHTPACVLVRGKDVVAVDAGGGGRRPCEMCLAVEG